VTAVPQALVIGQGTGPDVVRLLANGQIAATAKVTVNGSGQLDLGGLSNAIAGLTMTGGKVTGTGTLTLNGDVTATSASWPASITGLNGGFPNLGRAARTFTVNPGGSAEADLVLGETSAPAGLIKEGAGTLLVRENHGTVNARVNAGTLRL